MPRKVRDVVGDKVRSAPNRQSDRRASTTPARTSPLGAKNEEVVDVDAAYPQDLFAAHLADRPDLAVGLVLAEVVLPAGYRGLQLPEVGVPLVRPPLWTLA